MSAATATTPTSPWRRRLFVSLGSMAVIAIMAQFSSLESNWLPNLGVATHKLLMTRETSNLSLYKDATIEKVFVTATSREDDKQENAISSDQNDQEDEGEEPEGGGEEEEQEGEVEEPEEGKDATDNEQSKEDSHDKENLPTSAETAQDDTPSSQQLYSSLIPQTSAITKQAPEAYTFDVTKETIRSWGCPRRHETPFVFIHLGKAGGGSVRARIAASALHYNRSTWSDARHDETYFYPVLEEQVTESEVDSNGKPKKTTVIHKGVFVNSGFLNYRPSYPRTKANFTKDDQAAADKAWKTYEKTLPCSASTPLGQAIACASLQKHKVGGRLNQACNETRCDVVYTGHNLLGNELHWLPTPYLKEWWQSTPWSGDNDDTDDDNTIIMRRLWKDRSRRWHRPHNPRHPCHHSRKHHYEFYRDKYFQCVAPAEEFVDHMTQKILQPPWNTTQNDNDSINQIQDWSPLYASLPVLRVTMLREPFSWLVSKFFWHKGAIMYKYAANTTVEVTCDMNGTDFDFIAAWAGPHALYQINHLCGEDCVVRHHFGHMTLQEIETQSRHNLQHAFAVVGLLHETQTFYDMITARVGYMNTTLNPDVEGSKHSTKNKQEYQRCHDIYQTPEFQEKLLAASPELRTLHRLYQVGVQVNQFQQEEMKTCGTLPLS